MGSNDFNTLLQKPIGIQYKNYDYLMKALNQNIGSSQSNNNFNAYFEFLDFRVGYYEDNYDGYGTPIGEMTDPMYTYYNTTPWYKLDPYKPYFGNYLDYVEHTYLQYEHRNLFNNLAEGLTPERIILDKVGIVDGYSIMNSLASTSMGLYLDTHLGNVNNYFLSTTLSTTAIYNSNRQIHNKSISNGIYDEIGLSEKTVNDITTKFYFDDWGQIQLNFNLIGSPIERHGIGNVDMQYDNWLQNINYESLFHLVSNVVRNKKYITNISNKTIDDLYVEYGTSLREFYNIVSSTFQSINNDSIIRYNFKLTDNKIVDGLVHHTYAENLIYDDEKEIEHDVEGTFNDGVYYGIYDTKIATQNEVENLLNVTNSLYKRGKLETLISRFHTSNYDETKKQDIQTANSYWYGLSHGRNLLKAKKSGKTYLVNETNENGYTNPYCRVWTYHYQYNKLQKAIRPFSEDGKILSQGALSTNYNWSILGAQNNDTNVDEFKDGRSRLDKYGVLNKKNGTVNFSPTREGDERENVKVENCMFSIENLAWKGNTNGIYGLSKEQKGPLGGRIMWFPPYNLKFTEQVNVNWNENSIIGRGENIYTYINTARRGNLSFTIIADHPQIINRYEKYGNENGGDVDDVSSDEQRVLRFFAGCEVLNASKPTNDILIKYPILPTVEEIPSEVPEEIVITSNQIVFYVFYPNNYSGIDDRNSNEVNPIDYLLNGFGTQRLLVDENIIDIPTQHYSDVYEFYDDKVSVPARGYESLNGEGISHVQEKITSSIYKGNNNMKGRLYSDGTIDTPSMVSNYVQPNKFGGISEWHYRVDKRYETQKLLTSNYWDNISNGFNLRKGMNSVASVLNNNENKNLYSLSEIALALDDSYGNIFNTSDAVDKNKVKEIQDLLKNYKIKKISGYGMASSHGKNNWNKELNRDRFLTAVAWLQKFNYFQSANVEMGTNKVGNVTSGANKTNSVNDKYAKLYRSAKIVIELEKEEVKQIQENSSSFDLQNNAKTSVTTKYGIIQVPNSILTSINTQCVDAYGEIDYDLQQELIESYLYENPQSFFGNLSEADKDNLRKWKETVTVLDAQRKVFESEVGSDLRYDNEADFFQTLATTDPFLHNKITEKIKYFDPAFHSITPEGYNARLNFLHQCTRQGGTYSANEQGMNTTNATNLAFGRPPICVLRVGDFYSTKIVIDNISLDFESWDLNTEGIGVQPMLCNVNMSFTFLGGQDLAGPIARLQNALSFNYYKNTSVYDNRAEMVLYDENGKISKFRGIKR